MNVVRACWETGASIEETARLCHVSPITVAESFRQWQQEADEHASTYAEYIDETIMELTAQNDWNDRVARGLEW